MIDQTFFLNKHNLYVTVDSLNDLFKTLATILMLLVFYF